ncbi:MAG: gliding motility-associated C-terminal domain-containing protein [Prevotella sp.]|nr:gliding motility-associated C-terminal domain-containing protein [Prevotella sp.]MBR6319779.1 gliding motility-associated C-terminal domain-containing protein [Prevotella sp.]
MTTFRKFFTLAVLLLPLAAGAQSVNPMAYYIDEEGVEQETTQIDKGEAPLTVTFRANPSDMDDWTPSYEWHFFRQALDQDPEELFVRYEEDTQYTFSESGTFNVMLKTFLDNEGTQLDSITIVVTIPDSKLEFPNAFSPNGDGTNDVFRAKRDYRSIVSFHAYIFNRWGQKLYEWTDPAGGWDGKYKGTDVREGVYFLLCKAKGADGVNYNFRKDVNLLRGFTESSQSSGTTTE